MFVIPLGCINLTYDRIPDIIIQSWGLELIEYINRKGKNEIVLDAGCSSGRLTKIIPIKFKMVKFFANLDSNMIELANERLTKISNVKIIPSNIYDIELRDKIDIVF